MKQILIADDSSTARMFTKRSLEIAGCRDAEFIEAQDGAEAFALIEQQPPDLVVTDIVMPNCSGEALLRKIRALPAAHTVPVIVITSTVTPEREKELGLLGATAIILKPVSPAKLGPVIKSLFGNKEKRGW